MEGKGKEGGASLLKASVKRNDDVAVGSCALSLFRRF